MLCIGLAMSHTAPSYLDGKGEMVTAKKVFWKKSFRKKFLIFRTKKKVLWKKSFYKKSLEIKSYQFETFFWLQYDFIQKRPRKKSPLIVENAWEQRMFTIMQKRGY